MAVGGTEKDELGLDFYNRTFEAPFLKSTHNYYEAESSQRLEIGDVAEYMDWVETRLREEEDRARRLLAPDTIRPLRNVCTNALLADHFSVLCNACSNLEEGKARILLFWAADNGQDLMIERLIGNPQVHLDIPDTDDMTPVLKAAKGGHVATMMLLIEALSSRSSQDYNLMYGQALHMAAVAGHPKVVKALIDQVGVDVNYQDPSNKATALHMAVEKHDAAVFDVLLGLGADMKIHDEAGNSPIGLAWLSKFVALFDYDEDKDLSSSIVSSGKYKCSVLRRKPGFLPTEESEHEVGHDPPIHGVSGWPADDLSSFSARHSILSRLARRTSQEQWTTRLCCCESMSSCRGLDIRTS
jgi:hypothetical protein